MKKQFLSFVLISFVLFNFGCKKNATGPVSENLQPGRRDYVWTIDTISTDPFIYITRFWGSAPNDIWACNRYLFHYDGFKWSEFKPGIYLSAQAIFGFAQNDVWAAGYSNFWHFDGTTWSLFSQHTLEGYGQVIFSNIWGNAPNDVYAFGFVDRSDGEGKGVIMHYDGVKWDFVSVPTMKISFIDIKSINGKLLIEGMVDDQTGTTFKLFEPNGDTFKELYSGRDYPKLTYLKDKLFVKIGKKIFKYYQGKLELFIDFSGTQYWDGFWGRTEKDFFCVTGHGLGHYNGTDLVTIYSFDINKLSPFSELFFEKEIFFLGRDEQANMSIIIKGKLAN